jgi:pyruvate formate lyase activating enzyme
MTATWNKDNRVRDSLLQLQLEGKVRCNTCERRCEILNLGTGWCRTRENRGGRLVTLIYGAVSSLAANPIEKKPLFHFYPGTRAMTAGSWSCNFSCPWCQNWQITKVERPPRSEFLAPERFVELTRESGCRGTSISFNEPTLSLEWSLDVFRLARAAGYYNTFVTNGYMTSEALDLLVDAGLDAITVAIKGSSALVRQHCGSIDAEKIWATCRRARARGVHLEVVTLVIPGINNEGQILRRIAERIAAELGREVPWHVTQYAPAFEYSAPATPVEDLVRARRIGEEAGLDYVYLGNVPAHRFEDTCCPRCHCLVVARWGFQVKVNRLQSGRCPECGQPVPGIWGEH